MTTKKQRDEKFAVEVCSPIDGRACWIVCNHVHTVAARRLEPPARHIPRISAEDFQNILGKVYLNLPLQQQNTRQSTSNHHYGFQIRDSCMNHRFSLFLRETQIVRRREPPSLFLPRLQAGLRKPAVR